MVGKNTINTVYIPNESRKAPNEAQSTGNEAKTEIKRSETESSAESGVGVALSESSEDDAYLTATNNNDSSDTETDAVPCTPDTLQLIDQSKDYSEESTRRKNIPEESTKVTTTGENTSENLDGEITSRDNTSSHSPRQTNGEEDKTTDRANEISTAESETKIDSTEKDPDNSELVVFHHSLTLEERLRETLKTLGIHNDVWQSCQDETSRQVSFVEESGLRCEEILTNLRTIGVGAQPGTTLSVFPTSIHLQYDSEDGEEDAQSSHGTYFSDDEKETEFKRSIKSRLVVAQVEASVEENAQLTFDYIMLIFLASWIAALGLGENSSVILVASMLISPLMGPILAGIFGTVVRNEKLRNLGLKSELIGLGICVAFGLFAGFIYAGAGVNGKLLGNSDSWPTPEMSSRGVARSLVSGICIAIPSGAGVALSILGGNAGSLVGVAISASLLPPAVNAGMLWALSLSAAISPLPVHSTNIANGSTSSLDCPSFIGNNYHPVYSCNMSEEAAILGTISLILTILNIVSIFLVGLLVLKLKEVSPKTSASQSVKEFFNFDIKVARASYQTTKGKQSIELRDEFKKTFPEYFPEKEEEGKEMEPKRTLYLKNMVEDVEDNEDVRNVLHFLPKSPPRISDQFKADFQNATKHNFKREEEYFNNLMCHTSGSDKNWRVYYTVHASDIRQRSRPTSPLSPPVRMVSGKKHPLYQQKSESCLLDKKQKPRPVSIPVTIKEEKSLDTGKKKTDLKLNIPESQVSFSPETKVTFAPETKVTIEDEEDRKEKFKKVEIEKGQLVEVPKEKVRFDVQTVPEAELKGESDIECDPKHAPDNETTKLLPADM